MSIVRGVANVAAVAVGAVDGRRDDTLAQHVCERLYVRSIV